MKSLMRQGCMSSDTNRKTPGLFYTRDFLKSSPCHWAWTSTEEILVATLSPPNSVVYILLVDFNIFSLAVIIV